VEDSVREAAEPMGRPTVDETPGFYPVEGTRLALFPTHALRKEEFKKKD